MLEHWYWDLPPFSHKHYWGWNWCWAISFKPLQTTLGIAHGDLKLVCRCSAMETHFMNLLMNSYCAYVASRDSLEAGVKLFLCATLFSTWLSHSVSLCGQPLCGWSVVAPRHIHFTITALRAASGSGQKSNVLTCWKGGILWRCHVQRHGALQ
jgi:hypothetical protein